MLFKLFLLLKSSIIFCSSSFILLVIGILFIQNFFYTIGIIDSISWNVLRTCLDNCVTMGIFFVSDIVISYFIIIRSYFSPKKKYSVFEKIVLLIVYVITFVNIVAGIMIRLDYKISDKREYEIIDQNRVIVSNYEDYFLVMNCKIQGETLIIKRGTYTLEDMEGVSVTYHKYDKVICE